MLPGQAPLYALPRTFVFEMQDYNTAASGAHSIFRPDLWANGPTLDDLFMLPCNNLQSPAKGGDEYRTPPPSRDTLQEPALVRSPSAVHTEGKVEEENMGKALDVELLIHALKNLKTGDEL